MRSYALFAFALVSAAAIAAPPRYAFTVLNPLAGDVQTSAISVDNNGRVLVESTDRAGNNIGHAHLYVRNADGTTVSIRPNGQEYVSSGYYVRGDYVVGKDTTNQFFRYRISTGTTEILTKPTGASGMYVESMNGNGDVAGEAGPKNRFIPTLWLVGDATPHIVYPESGASATNEHVAINDSRQVLSEDLFVGLTNLGETASPWIASGYLPNPGNAVYTDLAREIGTYEGRAFALSNSGASVGVTAVAANGAQYTTLWSKNGLGQYGYLRISQNSDAAGSDFFFPNAVNDSLMVAGCKYTERSRLQSDWGSGIDEARIYMGGINYRLQDLVYSTTAGFDGFVASYAWDMNSKGVVAGVMGKVFNGAVQCRALIATPLPPSARLTVTLGDFRGNKTLIPVTMQFRTPGTSTVVASSVVFTDATGKVDVAAPGAGTFDVTVKASHWLRKKVAGVVFASSDFVPVAVSLVNGDVDGNNVVAAVDRARVTAALGTLASSSAASAAADLNGDGVVNATDRAIVTARLGGIGDL